MDAFHPPAPSLARSALIRLDQLEEKSAVMAMLEKQTSTCKCSADWTTSDQATSVPLPLQKMASEVKDSGFYSTPALLLSTSGNAKTLLPQFSITISDKSPIEPSLVALNNSASSAQFLKIVRLPPLLVATSPEFTASRPNFRLTTPKHTLLYAPNFSPRTKKLKSSLKQPQSTVNPENIVELNNDTQSQKQLISTRIISSKLIYSMIPRSLLKFTGIRRVSFSTPLVSGIYSARTNYDRKPFEDDLFIRLVKGKVTNDEKQFIRQEMLAFKRDEMREAIESFANTNWNVSIG